MGGKKDDAGTKRGSRGLAMLIVILTVVVIFRFAYENRPQNAQQGSERAGLSVSIEKAREMPDEKLYDILVKEVVESMDIYEEIPAELKGVPLVFYVLDYFDLEVQNGGLCQFYTNSSKKTAPYISGALEAVGAESYRKLYNEFNEKYEINTQDLSSFAIRKLQEFDRQNARYPFGEFNASYMRLSKREPLNKLLISYVREHLEDFYG